MHDDFLSSLARQAQGNRSRNSVVGTINEVREPFDSTQVTTGVFEAAARLKRMPDFQHGRDPQTTAELGAALDRFLACVPNEVFCVSRKASFPVLWLA